MSEVEEALYVAAADREKNWIGGAWLEKHCQRLLRALAEEISSLRQELERVKTSLSESSKMETKALQWRDALARDHVKCSVIIDDHNNELAAKDAKIKSLEAALAESGAEQERLVLIVKETPNWKGECECMERKYKGSQEILSKAMVENRGNLERAEKAETQARSVDVKELLATVAVLVEKLKKIESDEDTPKFVQNIASCSEIYLSESAKAHMERDERMEKALSSAKELFICF